MTPEAHGRSGATERRGATLVAFPFARDRRRLRVGLVNTMPDAALAATERQFRTLVQAAAPERRVELALFHLPGMPRGEAARARLDTLYRPAEAVADARLDALVVTGAEPRAATLDAEPFWGGFTRLVDWARDAGVPTLWSCLAAHAALLHLDGVARRPLAQKCSGLYACRPASCDPRLPAPLLRGLGPAWVTPHSRGNTLDEAALEARGYRILSRADGAGVDMFARDVGGAPFLFLQGHPEYEPASLALEFRRDLQRYRDGARDTPPALPQGVFGPQTTLRLQALVAEARAGSTADWPTPNELILTPADWRAPAATLYRNWLSAGREEAESRLSA